MADLTPGMSASPERTEARLRALGHRLAQAEAAHPDLRPDLAKVILWANPEHPAPTDWSLVYLHGFSASHRELSPLPEQLALGEASGAASGAAANLFLTRLAGHGRSGDAMAEARLDDWLADAEEAIAIGAATGKRIVILATSTGATLTLLALKRLAAQAPDLEARIAAVVLVSPNLALKSRASRLLEWPLRNLLIPLLLGKRRGFQPVNLLHAAGWTTDYPVRALFPMADLVRAVRRIDPATFRMPALFIASPQDQVVDFAATRRFAEGWGGPVEMVDPEPIGDPWHHVPAGDALSPETTTRLTAVIARFLADHAVA